MISPDSKSPPEDARPPTRLAHWAALLALTLATLALRLYGLDYGLPHMLEQDSNVVAQVEHLRRGVWNDRIERDYPAYPLLTAYATLAWSRPVPRPPAPSDLGLEHHKASAAAEVLQVRGTVAVLSVLIVPATFLIARVLLGSTWGLFATALVAFSLLNQTLAQQARPHSVQAAFAALALAAAIRLVRRRGWPDYLLAGGAACLALGSLNNGIALLLPLLAAHLIGRGAGRRFDPRILAASGVALAAIPIFYGFLFTSYGLRRDQEVLQLSTHEFKLEWLNGGGLATIARALAEYEPVLLGMLGLSLGVLAWKALRGKRIRPSPEGLVVLAYAAPYLIALSIHGQTRDRFVIPALPSLAVFAVWGVADLTRAVGRAGARRLIVALAVASLLLPAAATARLAVIRARPDTLEEAAAWVAAHVRDSTVFLSPRPDWWHQSSSIDLPLGRTPGALKGPGGPRFHDYNLWSRYQRRIPDRQGPAPRFDLRWVYWFAQDVKDYRPPRQAYLDAHPRANFASMGPGFYVHEVSEGRGMPATEGLRSALQEFGVLKQRFSPDGDPERTSLPLMYRDGLPARPNPTLRILNARTWGPVVEIHHLAASALEVGQGRQLPGPPVSTRPAQKGLSGRRRPRCSRGGAGVRAPRRRCG